MPEINPVPFQYEPVCGDLYLDSFRQNFYMERLDSVKQALQQACFDHDVVRGVEGEIRFSDGNGENPIIRDVRYANPTDRSDRGKPWPDEIEVE